MASGKDIVAFSAVLLGSIALVVGFGGLELAGSQTTNFLCSIPGLSAVAGDCESSIQPDESYRLTTKITLNRNGIISNDETTGEPFNYKTSKKDNFVLSLPDSRLSFFLPDAENGVVDYVIKEDGTVISSDRKRLENIGAFEDEEITFESNVDSGTYTVEYVFDYELCQYGSCNDEQDTLTETVEVPKLPLGDY